MSNIDEQKKSQRKLAKQNRALAFKQDPQAGQKVCDAWCQHKPYEQQQIISVYWPLGDELDPLPLLMGLHKLGHQMVLPVMLGAAKPLMFRSWAPGDSLQDAGFGTREPSADKTTYEPDIILAPLLAFDQHGFRLGYGGGFYDRTLERLRQHKQVSVYGIAYAAQEVDQVVRGQYDQPLDGIVTQQGIMTFDHS